MSGQCFFSVIDHLFHLLLDGWIFGVREHDWDGDWAIALYQFEWGMNLFGMSSVISNVLKKYSQSSGCDVQ